MKLEECTKMWQLLGLALEDLKKAESKENVEVRMSVWVKQEGTMCYCCMAGAILMDEGITSVAEISRDIWNRIETIDFLRRGWVREAYHRFTGRWDSNLYFLNIKSYISDHTGFMKDMEDLYAYLKERDI